MILFFILLSACSAITYSQPQWYSTGVPFNRYINSLKFLGNNTILYGGGNEFNAPIRAMWLSHDKGLEWEIAGSTPGTSWIKSMAFLDTLQGFAVGDSAAILKTADGAYHWTTLPKPIENREFNKIIYVNPQILFIVGGTIPYPGIYVSDPDTMQTIVKSTDGGNTWNVVLDRKGFWLNSVSFTDALNGIAVGDKGVILKTSDGGSNWVTVTPPVSRDLKGIKMINSTVGYIVGGIDSVNYCCPDPIYIDSLSTILRTTNGGGSWSVIKDDKAAMLNDITFTNDSTGYIAGNKASLLKTSNAGLNWSPVVIPGAAPDENFLCVEFKNDGFGAIGAKRGEMHVYTTSNLADAYTIGTKYLDPTTTRFFGALNSHQENATTNYRVSLDSTNLVYSYLAEHSGDFQTGNSIALTSFDFSGLPPDTTIYYFFQARTLAGYTSGDTIRFFTGKPKYTFETLPASSVTTLSAVLNGTIDKLPTSATVSFEYGTSPLLGNIITAVPDTINDTLEHSINALLIDLDADQDYYYRLKGIHNGQNYYGSIQQFKTTNALLTLPATHIGINTVTFNGAVEKLGAPAAISFEYGTTLSFGKEVTASPDSVRDLLLHNFSSALNNLIPSTIYYYKLKASRGSKIYYGNIETFVTGNAFITLPATNITESGATLNGSIYQFHSSAALSFEYGTTSALGDTLIADPAIISDTAYHPVSAVLSGLQKNALYFYRLKGISNGTPIYGETKQFFASLSEIPNWDFQYWRADTENIPNNWNAFIGREFKRVSGHSGNFAMQLTGQSVVMNGIIVAAAIHADVIGGVPVSLSTPPDSIVIYAKYNIAPTDTAGIMIGLKKNGQYLGLTKCSIFGSSGGAFQRLSYKIQYDSLAVPDSVIAIIANTIFGDYPSPFQNNVLTVDDISFLPGNTKFANSDFEDWFSAVIIDPVGWYSINFVGLDPAHPENQVISKVYFDPPSDLAAEIKNMNFYGLDMIFAGTLSTTKEIFGSASNPGFSVLGKHVTLNGFYKFFPQGNDTMVIRINMTKDHLIISDDYILIADSSTDFIPFSIPINYRSPDTPDSANIFIQALNAYNRNVPKEGTRFIVDKLSFDGFVATNIKTSAEVLELDGMKVYPNPARDHLIIENIFPGNKECSLSLISISGQLLKVIKLPAGQRTAQLEVGDLSPGFYVLTMKKGDKMYSKKIVLQK